MKFKSAFCLTLIGLSMVFILQACETLPRQPAAFQLDKELLQKTSAVSETVPAGECDPGKGLEAVEALYTRKAYKEALLKTAELIERSCSREMDFQAYKMAGRIYAARQEPDSAAHFYMTAFELGNPAEQEEIRNLMIQSLSGMTAEQILQISASIEKVFKVDGRMLFGTGMVKFEAGKDKEALALMKGYSTRFPEEDNHQQARSVIETIESRKAFNRYRLGVLLPLSGAYAAIGNNILQAIKMAVDDYNGRHANARFQLIVRDTQADPRIAIAAVRELNHYKVSGVIGPMLTANAAAGEADRLQVPMIVLTQKEGIPGLGQYVFRNFITPRMQVEALVAHLTGSEGIKRFAVLYPDDKYGRTFSQMFVEMVDKHAGEITDVESYAPGETDFAGQIDNFIRGYYTLDKTGTRQFIAKGGKRRRHGNYKAMVGFQALFIPDSVTRVKLIAPQLLYHDIDNVTLAGTNLWQTWEKDGPANAYVKRVVFPSGFDASSDRGNIRKFVDGFESENGQVPGFIEAVAYDTSMMMMGILSEPGVESRADIVTKLKSSRTYPGMTGETSFDPFGEPVKEIDLVQLTAKAGL